MHVNSLAIVAGSVYEDEDEGACSRKDDPLLTRVSHVEIRTENAYVLCCMLYVVGRFSLCTIRTLFSPSCHSLRM